MSNELSFRDNFVNFMKSSIPEIKEVSGGTELVCYCKYCPDSKSHGHMYIKIPQSQDDPILFHCFKCQTSGILDSRKLIEWGIYDPIIGLELDKINSKINRSNKLYSSIKERLPILNHVYDFNLANMKLKYLNDRLGTNLSINECLSQKIVFNLKDVLDYNNIESYTRHPSIINQLNWNFIGFLSLDNNFVNLRRLCDEGIVYKSIDSRYINYNICGKHDNTEKMYVLPTTIDLSSSQKINIHIAEGPFDILSIRYNLRKESANNIFAAITGSGYHGLINHLINTFQIFYFDLHIYPDNDNFGTRELVDSIYQNIKPYGAALYEHRNISPGEKDFGVNSGRIVEKIYKKEMY